MKVHQTVNNEGPMPAARRHERWQAGFTVLELLVVMAIIGILTTIALPRIETSVTRAREAVLKQDLFQMREAIDQFYSDNGKYPDQLDELVNQNPSRSYLRALPKDPFTRQADWITVAPPEGDEGAIFDVHSASPLLAVDGSAYNTW